MPYSFQITDCKLQNSSLQHHRELVTTLNAHCQTLSTKEDSLREESYELVAT